MTETEIVKKLFLSQGDRIITPKSYLRIIKHHALYLGANTKGEHFICENVIGKGVILTRVKDFFIKNFEVSKIERFVGTDFERKVVIEKAISKLGTNYDLWNFNCESFTNEILHGKRFSNQVNNAFIILTAIFSISLILSTNESK